MIVVKFIDLVPDFGLFAFCKSITVNPVDNTISLTDVLSGSQLCIPVSSISFVEVVECYDN